MTLGAGLNRAQASSADPPPSLTWSSEPLASDLDLVGEIELRLDAASTALDTAWIVTLQDVDAAGTASDVTAGYLRASLRAVDEAASRLGAPVLACRTPRAVPIGEVVRYRVPLAPTRADSASATASGWSSRATVRIRRPRRSSASATPASARAR